MNTLSVIGLFVSTFLIVVSVIALTAAYSFMNPLHYVVFTGLLVSSVWLLVKAVRSPEEFIG